MKDKETLLKELLNDLASNHKNVCKEYKYIGTGNPLSEILIIGKEVACSIESRQYNEEILKNFNYWNTLKSYNFNNIQSRNSNKYEPLYPYKGQLLKKNNGKNWGTSVTWMNYQKLINKIYNKADNIYIDFHENVFITEVNSTPSKKTSEADSSSIYFRKNHILNSDFIKSFRVIVISGVGYFEITDKINEIEKIFQVNFIKKKYANKERENQPYWYHMNSCESRLLINTYQLSIGISDLLLQKIADEILSFSSNKIKPTTNNG